MVVTASSLGLAEEGASSSSAYGSANESQLTEQQQQQLAAQQQQQQQQQEEALADPGCCAPASSYWVEPLRSRLFWGKLQMEVKRGLVNKLLLSPFLKWLLYG